MQTDAFDTVPMEWCMDQTSATLRHDGVNILRLRPVEGRWLADVWLNDLHVFRPCVGFSGFDAAFRWAMGFARARHPRWTPQPVSRDRIAAARPGCRHVHEP